MTALEKAEKHFAKKAPSRNLEAGVFRPRASDALEREVKKFVKEIILELDPDADIFMPVQGGYGAVDLDFIVGIRGYYLAIECKVNGKKPTHRQLQTIEKKAKAGCVVLIIDQSNLEDLASVVGDLKLEANYTARIAATDSRNRYLNR